MVVKWVDNDENEFKNSNRMIKKSNDELFDCYFVISVFVRANYIKSDN